VRHIFAPSQKVVAKLFNGLSFTIHAVIVLVVRAEVVFVDRAHYTKLVVDVLQSRDTVPHVNASLQLFVHNFFTLNPSV